MMPTRMTQQHRATTSRYSTSTSSFKKKVAVVHTIFAAISTSSSSSCYYYSSVAFTSPPVIPSKHHQCWYAPGASAAVTLPTTSASASTAFFVSAQSPPPSPRYNKSNISNISNNNNNNNNNKRPYTTRTALAAGDSSSSSSSSPPGIGVKRYSSRCTPFTWDELVRIVQSDDGSLLDLLCRDPKIEELYGQHRQEVHDEWVSVYDFLLWDKFGFDRIKANNDTNKWQSSPRIDELTVSGDVHKVLVPNEFPYYVDRNNILHYVLWKTCEPITDEDIINAKRELLLKLELEQQEQSKRLAREEIVEKEEDVLLHWINPPHLQSLPGIHHAHFLLRRVIDDVDDDDDENKENQSTSNNKEGEL